MKQSLAQPILLADAQVGQHLTWQYPVHVDPFTSTMGTFSGTLTEPPIRDGVFVTVLVTKDDGWHTAYRVAALTFARVTP